MTDKVEGMTAEEIVRFLKATIQKHCGELPNCIEDCSQTDNFLIQSHVIVGDICEKFGLFAAPDEDWKD